LVLGPCRGHAAFQGYPERRPFRMNEELIRHRQEKAKEKMHLARLISEIIIYEYISLDRVT